MVQQTKSPILKEFWIFGWVTAKLRRGVITTIVGLQFAALVTLWMKLGDKDTEIRTLNKATQRILLDMIKTQAQTNGKADTLLYKIE